MLKIRFEGLICHIGSETEKTHAAVVKAHDHKPRIFIHGDHMFGGANALDEEIDEGDHFTFSVTPGTAKLANDNRFAEYVPRLQGLLEDDVPGNKDLHREVKEKEPHAHVFANVTYPEGELTTLDPQRQKLEFTPSTGRPWEQCVADVVEFSAKSNGTVTMTITHKDKTQRPVPMKPGAVVYFRNVANGNHFHHYRHLTKAGKMAKVIAGSDCVLGIKMPPNPECSNSAWP